VKNLLGGALLCVLVLGAASGYAANLEAKSAAAQPAPVMQNSESAGMDEVIREAGQTLDIGGTHIFAVLGGGLVAVSLLARRKSP
jgi:hypothetical protein